MLHVAGHEKNQSLFFISQILKTNLIKKGQILSVLTLFLSIIITGIKCPVNFERNC